MPTGTINYQLKDDEWEKEYELNVRYEVEPGERRTWDYPGHGPSVTFAWTIESIVDWSWNARQGVEVIPAAADYSVINKSLERLIEAEREQIEADCLEDSLVEAD